MGLYPICYTKDDRYRLHEFQHRRYPSEGNSFRRRLPVTIAAGFRCRDGVVLCADSRITVPGFLKAEEPKIARLAGVAHAVFYTFEGDVDFSRMAIEILVESMHEAELKGRSMILELRRTVRDIYEKYSKLSTKQRKLYLSLIVAIHSGNKVTLYKVSGPLAPAFSRCQFIGCGYNVAESVALDIYNPSMSVNEAAKMAVYALAKTKKYVDGCGGKSEVVRIYDNGSFSRLGDKDVASLERKYRRFLRSQRGELLAL